MISTEQIVCVTESIVDTMIGSRLEFVSDQATEFDSATVTGCIQISGEWTGTVLLQTTEPFVRSAACKMLALDPAEVQKVDCQDAVAELVNMIGGNLKSLVPGPSSLSLPTVTLGNHLEIHVSGSSVQNTVDMLVDFEKLRVIVCRANA